ncbi:MAG: single-stranded-DNA-specific exonuclease RecJ [Planctomycetota bacterium]|nr:single-stranded-DNA-specific exonuclease RecJ [Planctomycetota bacterium]
MPSATDRMTAGPLVRGLTKLWTGQGVEVLPNEDLVTRVLRARGLTDPDARARFLEPSLRHLHDPSGIPDMDRAAARVLHAARTGEPIVLYGDYDVDGVTSVAILHHVLRLLEPGAVISSYVPHRLEEGYGLNAQAIRDLAARGAKVIVSVDCGVTAVEPARVARDAGVDLIITDHHNPPATMGELPDAYAVVHPRRPDSVYPFGDLCGAGVAFKLAWRLATMHCGGERVPPPVRELLLELLALAALGVIADVVPLRDENRVIARFGLARIKHSGLGGLRALVEASGLSGENVREDDVGFTLAPRLNACGRMGHAREAVELLTVAEGDRAREIAEGLTRLNNERRATEREIFRRACELAEQGGMTGSERRAIVLADPAWHAGVVGIVCSRLVERYHRPAILLCEADGACHGSGRSIDGFSLHAALAECAAHLTGYGGHDMAAGMRLSRANLDAFAEAFVGVANRQIDAAHLVARGNFDTDAGLHEFSLDTARRLGLLGPFGRENPPVRLRVRGVRVATLPETFGPQNKHLSLRVTPDAGGAPVRLVGWNWGARAKDIPRGSLLDVFVTPRINEFNGRRSVECDLHDLLHAGA